MQLSNCTYCVKFQLNGKIVSPKKETNTERRKKNDCNHDSKSHNNLEKELTDNTSVTSLDNDKCTNIKTANKMVKIKLKNILYLLIFRLISKTFDLKKKKKNFDLICFFRRTRKKHQ